MISQLPITTYLDPYIFPLFSLFNKRTKASFTALIEQIVYSLAHDQFARLFCPAWQRAWLVYLCRSWGPDWFGNPSLTEKRLSNILN